MNKELRQSIMAKHIAKTETNEGINVFFAYNEAMQEYADIQSKQDKERVSDLESQLLLANQKVELNYNSIKQLEIALSGQTNGGVEESLNAKINELYEKISENNKRYKEDENDFIKAINDITDKYNELKSVADKLYEALKMLHYNPKGVTYENARAWITKYNNLNR